MGGVKRRFFPNLVTVGILLVLVLGCGRKPLDTEEEQIPSASGNEMLESVNQVRLKGAYCGGTYYPPAPRLEWEARLEGAAREHGDEMNQESYFDHTGLDGSRVGDRVSRQGYSWSYVGENIARGQTTVSTVMADWLESEGHCRNLMNPKFRQLGSHKSGKYWVQVFANPAGS